MDLSLSFWLYFYRCCHFYTILCKMWYRTFEIILEVIYHHSVLAPGTLWFTIFTYIPMWTARWNHGILWNLLSISFRLLASLSEYQYTRKSWKKEGMELLLDPQFFQMDLPSLQHWRCTVDNLMTHDKTTFKELMGTNKFLLIYSIL